jgi:NADPH:quinone reductase-like Zn-dependent oxidoreductase
MRAYPYGGLSQFITAPASALVKLPGNVSFEAAARFGYFGTAYSYCVTNHLIARCFERHNRDIAIVF